MSIKTKLRGCAAFTLALSLALAVILAVTSQQTTRADAANRRSNELSRMMFDLNEATTGFMLRRESAAGERWLQQHEDLGLALASEHFRGEPERAVALELSQYHRELGDLFRRLLSLHEMRVRDRGLPPQTLELEERLMLDLSEVSRTMYQRSFALTNLSHEDIIQTHRNSLMLMMLMAVTLGLSIALILGMVVRSVVIPISLLQRGVQIVSGGNLDHKLKLTSHDEIGELARTFDQMTERLKTTTVSRDRLAEEIHRRQALEETLESLRVQHQLILNSAGEGIFGVDLGGCVTFVNPAAGAMFGSGIEELIGRRQHQTQHHSREDGAPYPESECPIHQVLLDGVTRHGQEEVFWRGDGSPFPVEYICAPLRDDAGKLFGAVVTFRDISQRKQLESQLLQAQKMESVGRLAGGVAHDFNNLLTAIIGYAQLGLNRLSPQDGLRRNLEEIQRSGERAAHLTAQLLAFSRRQVIEPRVVDLNQLIGETGHMLSRLIDASVAVEISLDRHPAPVKVDPVQFEQVLLNLVVNSQDAMPQGGRLGIVVDQTYLGEGDAARFPDLEYGDYVELRVSDTGVGMSQAVQAHIFEPFFTTKEQGKGTGLGLATCYGIVKQNGGQIAVESWEGVGSIFHIYLPRASEPLSLARTPGGHSSLPSGDEWVLLVEDEPAVRAMTTLVLREQGYHVLEAVNGEDALELVRVRDMVDRINLLMTDVVMPRMGGKELADRMKQIRPDIKVLFMSGYNDEVVNQHGIVAPEVEFLQKPTSLQLLARKVREVLDKGTPSLGFGLE